MCKNYVFALILVVVLMGVFGLAIMVPTIAASGTIYIRANGSVEGTDKITSVDNVTYVFTDDIFLNSIVVERSNITIDGNRYTIQGSGSGNGFYWYDINNVTVKNTNIKDFAYGVFIRSSSNSTVSGNTMTNIADGVFLFYSYNTTVSGNTITNSTYGVGLGTSDNSVISGNIITNSSSTGISIDGSDNTVISGNAITNSSSTGVSIWSSNNGIVSGNTIANSIYGVFFSGSSNNKIYHNNFINNLYPAHASLDSPNNVWDDGYPSGGNYWSGYSDVDICSGPYQNQTGNDGIWDHPYVIDANNRDNYPTVPEFSPHLMVSMSMVSTLLAVTVYKREQSPH
jgi:parallel beta-helix repeat protein